MSRRFRRLGGFCLAAMVVLAPVFVLGQQAVQVVPAPAAKVKGKAEGKADDPVNDSVSLPRNPESKRLIQAAQDYIKKKEWRIAAECLQSLLENPDDSFVEVKRKDARGVEQEAKVSVRDEANRIIGQLPADGLESYQIQYGQVAADKLREALERADATLLAEVSQRYLHTKAGSDATTLLGTFHLDRGQYLMATLCYERLLSRPDADKLPPKTLFKAALAYRRAGDTATATKLITKVLDKLGRGDLVLGRVHMSHEQVRAELDRDMGNDVAVGLFDWPVYRGNAGRNALMQGSTPYLTSTWSASMIEPDSQVSMKEKPVVEWIQQHLDVAMLSMKDKPVLPAFFPITAGNRLLVRTYDGVSAYALSEGMYNGDNKKPGELIWRQSADQSLYSTLYNDINGRRTALDGWYDRYYRAQNNFGVLFDNSVLGSISHDGRRVYFVDDLGIPPHYGQMIDPSMGGGMNTLGPFAEDIHCNFLCATDIDTGKLSWHKLGGRTTDTVKSKPDKEPAKVATATTELMDTFFLGPPLPLGGKLYLLCEKNGELRLVCLDAERSVVGPNQPPPELVWIQSLGTANAKLPNDTQRRSQAAHLAYGDGILVCPTNAGAVIGVDLLTHSLVWAFSYRRAAPPNMNEDMMWRFNGRFPRNNLPPGQQLPERWRPTAPCIVKDKVVLTPHDATEIHCINLRDGHKLWSVPREAANDLYLAGVFDGRVIVVAKNEVRALDLETGKEVWKCTETGLPSGQGVASDGFYYLPLATSTESKASEKGPEICAIDIKSGKIQMRTKARSEETGKPPEMPGNLLFAGSDLISQSATKIASFPLLKVKLKEISERLAKNPNDPAGLADRGELHLYNGEVRDAVADLRSALANQPPDAVRAKARNKLYDGLTRLLQADFAAAEQYLAEYDDLCKVAVPTEGDAEARQKLLAESIRRRASFLELVGKGRERQGRVLEAFKAYEQYGELSGHRELVDSMDEPNTKARPDIWSRGRIQSLLANAKPEDKKVLEAEIARRWEQVRTDTGLDGLRKFVNLYGSMSAVGLAARLEFCTRLLATNDPDDLTEAERLLAVQCYTVPARDEDASGTAKAIDLMIRVCLKRGQYETAVGFYKRLGTQFANVVVRDGKTGKELLEELPTDKRFIPYLEAPTLSWPGPLTGKEVSGHFQNNGPSLTVEPQGELSPFFDRHRLALEVKEGGNWTLRLIDRVTGEDRWRSLPLPMARSLNSGQSTSLFVAFARGQDLILHINNYVYAFDLVRRKELWRKNLFGSDPLLNSQDNNVWFGDDGLMQMPAGGRTAPVGRIAIVESAYVCLQTRDGLIALDPVLPGPSIMWAKTDVSMKAQVFGDDRHVFIVEPESEKDRPRFRVLNAANGVAIPANENVEAQLKKLTEALTRKTRFVRGNVLVADTGGKVLRLFDPFTGTDRWKREFSASTVIVRCDDPRLVAAVEPAGLFTLLDVHSGEIRFTSRLQPSHTDKLQQATLVSDRDRYYLALMRQPEPGMTWEGATSKQWMRSANLNGPVYAMAKKSGKQLWVCDFLPYQSLVLDQFADLPVMLFTASYEKRSGNIVEKQGIQVTAVDKASGKLIYNNRELVPSPTPFHALTSKFSERTIELVRPDLKMVFSATAGTPPTTAAMPTPRRDVPVITSVPVVIPNP